MKERMKIFQKMKARTLFSMLIVFSLSGCAVGFNKNGFYCTEGPVTDETPPCFGHKTTPPQP
jgi:hypothetical protein